MTEWGKIDSTCWARLFFDYGPSGDRLELVGPTDIENLNDVRGVGGWNPNDQISAVTVGPSAWVELFQNYGYSGNVLRLPPNTVLRNLTDLGWNDEASGVRIYDRRPNTGYWDDTVDLGSKGAYLDAFHEQAVNRKVKDLTLKLLELVPEVGSILANVFDVLWPAGEADPDSMTWQQAKQYANFLTQKIEAQHSIQNLQNYLETLARDIYEYTTIETWEKLSNILDYEDEKSTEFVDREAPSTTLRYFTCFATLHLATLRETLVAGPKIFPCDPGDPDCDPEEEWHQEGSSGESPAEYYARQFERYLEEYSEALVRATEELRPKRGPLVGTEHQESFGTTGIRTTAWAYDRRDDWHGLTWRSSTDNYQGDNTGDADDAAAADKEQRLQQVSAAYGAELDSLLSTASLWSYLGLGIEPGSEIHVQSELTTVFDGPFGNTKSGTSAHVVATHDQRIDRVEMKYDDEIVWGLRLYVDGEPGPALGNMGWGQQKVDVRLDDDEYIVGAWGAVQEGLAQLFFRTSKGREFGGGLGDTEIGVSWPFYSSPPDGTFQLVGGHPEGGDLEGIEGVYGSSDRPLIERITFRWRYRRFLRPDGTWPGDLFETP